MRKISIALCLLPLTVFGQGGDVDSMNVGYFYLLVIIIAIFLIGYIWAIVFVSKEAAKRKINYDNTLVLSIFATPIAGLLYIILNSITNQK